MADTGWREDDYYSKLAGNGVDFLARRDLGLAIVDGTAALASADEALEPPEIFSATSLGVVLLDERQWAIGYATFEIHWAASRRPGDCNELEVILDEAWLAPARRGQGLGTTMANAVVDGVWRHLVALETTLPKSHGLSCEFDLLYTGDVYSRSGEAFMRACWQVHQEWLRFPEVFGRLGFLVEKSVDYDPRW